MFSVRFGTLVPLGHAFVQQAGDGALPKMKVTKGSEMNELAVVIDDLVGNAQKALATYADFTQEQIDYIVGKASVAALDKHGELARLAVDETGRGVFEDKAVKNIFACEHVTNSMAGMKTVGIIHRDDINGITEIADPVGVVCAVTPVTNPTSTTIFKALLALKTRNPIIFAFHPNAQRCSAAAARVETA